MNNRSINSRIASINEEARSLFKNRKRDTLVLVVPWDNKKGWIIDVCHYLKKDGENLRLRRKLEACETFEELTEALDGYTTNVPGVMRSDEYEE